ncbi:MAG: SurA N-terminal domain-containing protein [Desulfonauticus sp.]|nr:SurA N-terminal domain-containing protein [Desulfonauticus sp.]
MLDFMRRNARSWGIKIVFGLIIVVFIFWGIGSYRSNKAAIVAEVNGRPIPVQEFSAAYERTIQKLRQQNPNLSSEQLKAMQVKEQVLNQLINAELLKQKAEQLGIDVTPVELRKAITSLPFFQNKNKQFDPNLYQQLLKLNGLTPADFEHDYAHNLLIEKIRSFITLPAKANWIEVYDLYKFAREKVQVEYVLFAFKDYFPRIEISDKEIQAYYNQNKNQFMSPEKIKIAYLELTPQKLAYLETVSPKEIEEYYTSHKNNFFQPERVKARHILIRLPQNATQEEVQKAEKIIAKIQKELKKGVKFSELAKKYSEGPSKLNGGELGWFSKKDVVPSFAKAAFALKVGEVSKPVRTPFGLHLILVEDKKPAGIAPLAEVKDKIKTTIAQSKAYNKMQDLLDTVLTRLAAGEKLDKVSRSLGLKLEQTDLFSRNNLPEPLSLLKPKDVQTVFALPLHEVTKTPLTLPNGYLFVEKIQDVPAKVLPLAQVKTKIKNILLNQKAKEMALKDATSLLAKLQKDPMLKVPLKITKPFGRQGFIPELGFNKDLVQASFQTKPNTWLDVPYQTTPGYVLVRPIKRIFPDKKGFDQEKQKWLKIYENFKAKQIFSDFISALREKAEIKIINPRYLQY